MISVVSNSEITDISVTEGCRWVGEVVAEVHKMNLSCGEDHNITCHSYPHVYEIMSIARLASLEINRKI